MTGKSDFTEEEWKLVVEAPPSAGLLVIAADRGGSIREKLSMAKTYTEARKEHGEERSWTSSSRPGQRWITPAASHRKGSSRPASSTSPMRWSDGQGRPGS